MKHLKPFVHLFWLLLFFTASLRAQSITIGQLQTEISVAPGFNHAPIRLPVSYRTNSAADLARLSVSSDATWAAATIDIAGAAIVLSFTTGSLTNRSYTATLTVTDGTVTAPCYIKATIAPLNIVALLDDPTRSRTYGIQQDGLNIGSVVVFDPLTLNAVANITVGKKPTDLAISADGTEMLVICSVDKSITAVDLRTLAVRETIALPAYNEWGQADTSANVKYGAGNIIYYIDGAWGPVLNVLDRSSRKVLQSIFFDGTAFAGAGNSTDGFGDIVLSPDKSALFAWSQYGWSAGSGGSAGAKFTINANGTLTRAAGTQVASGMQRDPLNTPALISSDGKVVFLKQYAFSASTIATTLRTFPSPVFAISPGGEIVSTPSAIYDYSTGNKLYDLPVTTTVQTITSDYARLVYFDSTAKALKTVNLFDKIGTTVLKRDSSPANQSITLPPSKLQWASVAGVDRYRVYLGESSAAVKQAGLTSPEFLSTVTGTTFTLTTPLVPGKTYYWRVDVVTDSEVVPGDVQSFTVSTIASNVSTVDAATVRGHSNFAVPISLTSATPGKSWTASSASSWIKFAAASGITPATLNASLDASALNPGVTQGEIKITGPDGTFTIPVRLQVDALAFTVMRSDPQSAMIYAVSEVSTTNTGGTTTTTTTGTPQAYLLEIDSQSQAIKRVATVGAAVSDLAIHRGDNRLYVANWRTGSLLAINLATFATDQTYAFKPFGAIGYGGGDIYRVAAGGAGRLVYEEQDQWINIYIYDTTKGAALKSTFVREGGGLFAPTGRYYYHGDNNSSGAEIHKYDTIADQFAELVHTRGTVSSYYGSRTIVISEDGHRIFWAGSVFNENLAEEWAIGTEVYSASADGRYAFGESKIYDIAQKKVAFGMPVATRVSAFNSTSGKLVLQQDQRIAFYPLSIGGTLPDPKLAADTITATTVKLTWIEDALQTGFTLQMRLAGAATWTDFAGSIASTANSQTITSLKEETAYEFRLKADSPSASSNWSNIVSATTLPAPPATPSFNALTATSPTSVSLQWSMSGIYDSVTIERAASSFSTTWTVVATVAPSVTTYNDINLATSTTYSYRLKATRAGSDSPYTFTRSVTLVPPAAPVFTRQPASQTVLAGTAVTFSAAATGNPTPTFQWYKNETPIPSATNTSFTITAASSLDAGSYKVSITNSAGTVTSSVFTLTVAPSTSRMINFSILSSAGGGNVLTAGFTISGGPKNILVRGLGPTLSAVGVSGVLADPQLTVFRHDAGGAVPILSNNDWSSASNKFSLQAATARLTALPFVSDPSRDAAVFALLNIDGGYSAQVSSADASAGAGAVLVEVYDADSGTPSRLANISALAQVTSGNVLTAGFVLTGTTKRKMLIRGVGPALGKIGVTGFLADPQLTLFRQGTTSLPIASNNDWSAAANKTDILAVSAVTVGLTLNDPSTDAVIVIDLDPGAYTAQVSSADGSSGLALVEVYDVP